MTRCCRVRGAHIVFFCALAVFLVATTLRIHRDIHKGKGSIR